MITHVGLIGEDVSAWPKPIVVEKLLDISVGLNVVAHWCRQCKSLESEFDEVATSFRGSNIRLAKVDGTVETKLVDRFQVRHLDMFCRPNSNK